MGIIISSSAITLFLAITHYCTFSSMIEALDPRILAVGLF